MYRKGYKGRAFFTAQEEAGRSWRFLLEWFRRFDTDTDKLLVLDTSPYPTRELAEVQDIVLRHRDANAVFESPLLQEIEQTCQTLDISYSFKDAYLAAENVKLLASGATAKSLGTTEMGRIIVASEGKIQGTTLQLPTTGYHTTAETISIRSVGKALHLLRSMYLD